MTSYDSYMDVDLEVHSIQSGLQRYDDDVDMEDFSAINDQADVEMTDAQRAAKYHYPRQITIQQLAELAFRTSRRIVKRVRNRQRRVRPERRFLQIMDRVSSGDFVTHSPTVARSLRKSTRKLQAATAMPLRAPGAHRSRLRCWRSAKWQSFLKLKSRNYRCRSIAGTRRTRSTDLELQGEQYYLEHVAHAAQSQEVWVVDYDAPYKRRKRRNENGRENAAPPPREEIRLPDNRPSILKPPRRLQQQEAYDGTKVLQGKQTTNFQMRKSKWAPECLSLVRKSTMNTIEQAIMVAKMTDSAELVSLISRLPADLISVDSLTSLFSAMAFEDEEIWTTETRKHSSKEKSTSVDQLAVMFPMITPSTTTRHWPASHAYPHSFVEVVPHIPFNSHISTPLNSVEPEKIVSSTSLSEVSKFIHDIVPEMNDVSMLNTDTNISPPSFHNSATIERLRSQSHVNAPPQLCSPKPTKSVLAPVLPGLSLLEEEIRSLSNNRDQGLTSSSTQFSATGEKLPIPASYTRALDLLGELPGPLPSPMTVQLNEGNETSKTASRKGPCRPPPAARTVTPFNLTIAPASTDTDPAPSAAIVENDTQLNPNRSQIQAPQAAEPALLGIQEVPSFSAGNTTSFADTAPIPSPLPVPASRHTMDIAVSPFALTRTTNKSAQTDVISSLPTAGHGLGKHLELAATSSIGPAQTTSLNARAVKRPTSANAPVSFSMTSIPESAEDIRPPSGLAPSRTFLASEREAVPEQEMHEGMKFAAQNDHFPSAMGDIESGSADMSTGASAEQPMDLEVTELHDPLPNPLTSEALQTKIAPLEEIVQPSRSQPTPYEEMEISFPADLVVDVSMSEPTNVVTAPSDSIDSKNLSDLKQAGSPDTNFSTQSTIVLAEDHDGSMPDLDEPSSIDIYNQMDNEGDMEYGHGDSVSLPTTTKPLALDEVHEQSHGISTDLQPSSPLENQQGSKRKHEAIVDEHHEQDFAAIGTSAKRMMTEKASDEVTIQGPSLAEFGSEPTFQPRSWNRAGDYPQIVKRQAKVPRKPFKVASIICTATEDEVDESYGPYWPTLKYLRDYFSPLIFWNEEVAEWFKQLMNQCRWIDGKKDEFKPRWTRLGEDPAPVVGTIYELADHEPGAVVDECAPIIPSSRPADFANFHRDLEALVQMRPNIWKHVVGTLLQMNVPLVTLLGGEQHIREEDSLRILEPEKYIHDARKVDDLDAQRCNGCDIYDELSDWTQLQGSDRRDFHALMSLIVTGGYFGEFSVFLTTWIAADEENRERFQTIIENAGLIRWDDEDGYMAIFQKIDDYLGTRLPFGSDVKQRGAKTLFRWCIEWRYPRWFQRSWPEEREDDFLDWLDDQEDVALEDVNFELAGGSQ